MFSDYSTITNFRLLRIVASRLVIYQGWKWSSVYNNGKRDQVWVKYEGGWDWDDQPIIGWVESQKKSFGDPTKTVTWILILHFCVSKSSVDQVSWFNWLSGCSQRR